MFIKRHHEVAEQQISFLIFAKIPLLRTPEKDRRKFYNKQVL